MTMTRKERFLAEKAKEGNAAAVIKKAAEAPYVVYFTKSGEIMCLTSEKIDTINKDWLTYDFPQADLSILINNDNSKYEILEDQKTEGVFYISLKNLTAPDIVVKEADFLQEIKINSSPEYDILIKLNEDELIITMSALCKQQYDGVDPSVAMQSGKKYIKLYITAKSDPHTLLHYELVSINSLILNEHVCRKLYDDFRLGSIYTFPVFDSCVRANRWDQ